MVEQLLQLHEAAVFGGTETPPEQPGFVLVFPMNRQHADAGVVFIDRGPGKRHPGLAQDRVLTREQSVRLQKQHGPRDPLRDRLSQRV